jgi:hypothetical protein
VPTPDEVELEAPRGDMAEIEKTQEKSTVEVQRPVCYILSSGRGRIQRNDKKVRYRSKVTLTWRMLAGGWHDWSGSGVTEISHVQGIIRVIYYLCVLEGGVVLFFEDVYY